MRIVKGCLIALGVGVIGVIALVLLVAIFGPRSPGTQATTKADPKTPARIGERAESAGIAITVNSVQKVGEVNQVMRAKPGRIYAVADVSIETTGREKAPYNPLYFKVRDADGREYTASPSGTGDYLKSGELNQGERVRGTVAFDVPTDAKGLTLSYQPTVIFGGYETIRVALEQGR